MDVRTEQQRGKLLFQWEPSSNVISIVQRDTVYEIKLSAEDGRYEIIGRHDKRITSAG